MLRRTIVAWCALILLCASLARAQEKRVVLADVATAPALSADDAARLARYIGERLHASKSLTPLPPALKADVTPRVVFVSVSNGDETAHVVMAPARGAMRAADAAIAQMTKRVPDVAQRLWIKVDVVTRVDPLPAGATNLALGINPSLEGLELAGGVAFLSEELQGWHLVGNRRLIEESIYDYLDARPARGSVHNDAELRPVRRFACSSFFIRDDNTPDPLYRGHRAFTTATSEDLHASAEAAAEYLVRSIQPTGKQDYSYRIDMDEVPREYNIVRHAGAIWSMVDWYKHTKDEETLAAIERSMRYLLAQVRPMRVGDVQAAGVVEEDVASLGGNALAALALASYIEVTGKKEHLPILRVLAKSMLAAQAPGGRFVIQRQKFSTGDVLFEDGPYAPGEAIVAMLKVDDVDPDPALVDGAVRGAKFLITVRDADKLPEELAHDHWLLYALRALHARRPDKMYVEHSIRLCRSIIDQQHKRGDPKVEPDAIGAWSDARSTPAAVRSEGLLAASALMQSVGRVGEAKQFRDAARESIAFQLRTQVWPESAMHCRNPRRAIGGFREDLGGVYIRMDFVQHNLSGILELIRQTEPAKTPVP